MLDYTGKTVIITGSARGIGRGIATLFAKQGAKVVVADLLEKEGQETVDIIKKDGGEAIYHKTDVTNLSIVEDMVKKTIEAFSKIDVLVNNVGWDDMKPFIETTPDFWEKIIAINLKGALNCTKAVLPHMIERKYGKIVYISSDAGRVGSMGEAVYSACKGGIIAFTKTLAREMARYTINVNCICPGPTETPLVDEMKQKSQFAQKVFGAMQNIIPLRRLGRPEDIAAAVVFIASDEANYITGQVLSVSGGLTMC